MHSAAELRARAGNVYVLARIDKARVWRTSPTTAMVYEHRRRTGSTPLEVAMNCRLRAYGSIARMGEIRIEVLIKR